MNYELRLKKLSELKCEFDRELKELECLVFDDCEHKLAEYGFKPWDVVDANDTACKTFNDGLGYSIKARLIRDQKIRINYSLVGNNVVISSNKSLNKIIDVYKTLDESLNDVLDRFAKCGVHSDYIYVIRKCGMHSIRPNASSRWMYNLVLGSKYIIPSDGEFELSPCYVISTNKCITFKLEQPENAAQSLMHIISTSHKVMAGISFVFDDSIGAFGGLYVCDAMDGYGLHRKIVGLLKFTLDDHNSKMIKSKIQQSIDKL